MKFEAQKIPLRKIRIDGDTQPRAEINLETVTEYAEAMMSGSVFPPIETYFDGVSYWLADGFHRYHAAIKAGLTELDSKVGIPGTANEAKWASLAANHRHGLRRTNADKRRSVEMALKIHPEMSDNALAEHCGVSQPLVSTIRALLITVISSQPPPSSTRIGINGKKYNYPPAPIPSTPPKNSVPPKVDTPPETEEKKEPLLITVISSGPPPSSKRTAPPVIQEVKDSIGRIIPKNLLPLWNRSSEITDLLDGLSKTRCTLRKAQNTKDALYATCNFSAVLAEVDSAYTQLKSIQPYAVCPSCQGNGACRVCGDGGIISKFRWDTVVSQELKDITKSTIEAQK